MEQNNSSRSDRESGNKKWYKERRLVVLVGLLVVLMIALVTALCLQMTFSSLKNDDGEMCLTDECIRTAARMIEGMNRTIAPCEDFYEFACSGWLSRHSIPPTQLKWDQLEIITEEMLQNLRILLEEPDQEDDLRPLKLARAFYKTCMDTESVEELKLTPIFEMLSRLGLSRDLLLFDNSKNDTEIELDSSRIAGVASRYLNVNFFVKLSIIADSDFDLNKFYLEIEQILPSFEEHHLTHPDEFESELMEYKRYIKEMVELAGVTSNNSASFADEILEFSTKMAKIMVRPGKSAGPSLVTVSEFQTLTDASALRWNWTEYLQAVFKNTDVILETDVDKVSVENLEYLQKLPLLLSTTPRLTIGRFVWWSVYSTIAPQIFEKCWEMKQTLIRKLRFLFFFGSPFKVDRRINNPRWQSCVARADSVFTLVLTNVYMQRYIHDQAREKAIEMFLEIKAAFDEMLSKSKWMDVETRAIFRKKLNAMKSIVGFPQWTTDHEKLNKCYEGTEVIPGNKFGTFLRLTDVEQKWISNTLRGNSSRDDCIPLENNLAGIYYLPLNTVLMPGVLLQLPFYSNGLESINYGALGMIMGHEISHGFGTKGINYDENGKRFQRWNDETLRHYREKTECFIKQYSSYHLSELGANITIEGDKTVDENMSDNEGIRLAYRAYQRLQSRGLKEQTLPGLSDYTQDQLFFLSFAQTWCGKYSMEGSVTQYFKDEHSPYHFRVIGTLSNNEDFSKAWNCPIESPMNPSHKCVIW